MIMRAGALITKGEPGIGVSEPSALVLKPLIRGASEGAANKNRANRSVRGTVAAIGVGVPVGVGVGDATGVGVGDGLSETRRRGEITHPARTRLSTPKTAITSRKLVSLDWQTAIIELMPCSLGLLADVICAVFKPM